MARDKKYEKMILEINQLKEELINHPDNITLKNSLAHKEEDLMLYVMDSSKELEKYMRHERENNLYGDEHSY